MFQTVRYGVHPATGAVGNAITDNFWFDAVGNQIKSLPAGSKLFSKTVYDSLGRQTKQYVGYDLDESTYGEAGTVAGDTILEQTETLWDAAGNAIQTTLRQRYHNAPATQTGELQNPSNTPKARVTYAAAWHDAVGRQIATADYGTNGGSALSRPSAVPERADTVLVTSMDYDDASGEMHRTVDPAGMPTCFENDAVGRETKRILNCQHESSSSSSSSSSGGCPESDDVNVTVLTTYTPDGQTASITAVNSNTGDQTTRFVYGTTLSDSDVARSDLLRAEIYPDSDDAHTPLGNGTDGVYDRIEFKYNRQGQRTEMKDQNETVHRFDYDGLGRLTHDRVTSLGGGVDGAVRRISTEYEVRGMRKAIGSWDDATVGSGSLVNEVEFQYNDFGQLTHDYQSHSGAVNTSTTPEVQYAYADGANNHVRATSMTYPNGRVITFDYGSSGGIDDAASRVQSIKDGTLALAQYSYLGRNSFVEVDYTEPEIRYTLVDLAGSNDPDTGDIYTGFDRFARVKDSRWRSYGSSTDADRILYGYDRAGNRVWREQTTDPHRQFDELYGYDAFHRLKIAERGTLSSLKDAISAVKFAQCWSLDSTGNWQTFRGDSDGDGSWDLEQARSANAANEISDISETTGAAWVAPSYDRAGNMTTIPKPSDPAVALSAVYDGWNRLAGFSEGADTLAEYEYDGAKRQVVQKTYASGLLDQTRHLYYSTPDRWQVLEERVNSSSDPDRQFVCGLRYLDDLIARDRDSDSDGTLDERAYALQDANWNVTALANGTANILERYTYSAYGCPTYLDAEFMARNSSSYVWDRLFAGYVWLVPIDLYQVRTRSLHAGLGVWMQRDPLGLIDGVHLYEYAHSTPVNLVDPTGEAPPVIVGLGACMISPLCRCLLLGLGFGLLELVVSILNGAAPGQVWDEATCMAIAGCAAGICIGTFQPWECLGIGAGFCLACRWTFGRAGIPCRPSLC